MTSLVASESLTVVDQNNSLLTPEINQYKNRQRRHVFKENTNKHKCNKVLKRKLKKYKLRQDGKEDQDVIDVSKILVTTLIIKSPCKLKEPLGSESDSSDFEDLKPKNYLFKMVRRKAIKISKSLEHSNTKAQDAINTESPSAITSQEKKQTNAFKMLMDSRNKSIGSNSPGKEQSNDNSLIEEAVERKNLKAKRHLVLQKMAEAKGSLRNKEIEEYQDNIIKKQMEKRAQKLKSMILKDTKSVNEENEGSNDVIVKKQNYSHKVVSKDEEVINNNNLKKQAKTLKIVDIFNTIEDPITISPEKKKISKEDQDFLKKLSPSLKKKESMLCYFKKLNKEFECSPKNSDNDNLIKVKFQPRNKKRGKKKKLSLNRDIVETCELLKIEEVIEESNFNNEANDKVNVENKKNNEELNKTGKNQDKPSKEQNESETDQNKVSKVFVEEIIVHIPETTNINVAPLNGIVAHSLEVKSERHKRKRNSKVVAKVHDSGSNTTIYHSETRPKRSVKRPIKYTSDACLSSSDEELHIFTPKKKKHIESEENIKKPVDLKSSQSNNESVKQKCEKTISKDTVLLKKPAKLAPIFAPKQSDSAALEAKQKFLQSGVPDKLKKIISQKNNKTTPGYSFPIVVHVQQNSTTCEENNLVINIPLLNVTEDTGALSYEKGAFKKLLQLTKAVSTHHIDINYKKGTQIMLQTIKQLHPKFPVYRTYQYFKSRGKGEFKDCSYIDIDNSIEIMNDVADVINDSPDRLNWTDKYKAMSTNQIIGNFESIKELRKWLITWTENEMKSKPKSKPGSDSSDYYQSDTDSRDSMKAMNNLLILTGPTGCGKTASVYAVASDLAMKVIEVNASSKRTGKIMLQDLQEATQSHKVNRGTSSVDNSQKSQEKYQPDLSKKNKKRGRPKKLNEDEKTKKLLGKSEALSGSSMSQESTRTDSSLILIDDADIVFDQDDGFTSAIVQLVQCSKRPVILITSSLVCPHLQRFLQNGKILKMCPLLPRILGIWLDIMCLADSGVCWPGIGAKFLNYFKGDIRKTINYLQFIIPSYVHGVTSDEEIVSQNVDLYKNNVDEESSCISWADGDDTEGRVIASVNYKDDTGTNMIWTDFTDKHSNLLNYMYPVHLFNIWWSMPRLLSAGSNVGISSDYLKKPENTTKKNLCLELEAIANAVDALSLSDYISHKNPDLKTNITSQPWYYSEGNSVSERENSDFYHKEYEVTSEICQTMVTSSIASAQDILGCDRKTDISFPGMMLQRQRDRVVTRHKSLTSYLNASSVLERRALALDYWPSCRTICRFEKSKNDTNTKRNNRFCHYLKSLSVLCKSDTFDNLCDSLNSSEGTELKLTSFNEW